MIFIGGLGPVKPDHHWRECRPLMMDDEKDLATDTAAQVVIARLGELVVSVWGSLSPGDREAFHRYSCLGSTAGDDLVAVQQIYEALQAVIAIEQAIVDLEKKEGDT